VDLFTPAGDLDRLVQLLRWFDRHRDEVPTWVDGQGHRSGWFDLRPSVSVPVIRGQEVHEQ
jgi:hypothetical protein